jgi:hypothetical protein
VFAHGVKLAAQAVHLPVSDPATTGGRFFWGIDFGVSEDLSAYGVIGGPLLLLLSCWWLAQRRRTDARVVLGVALPLFLVLLALTSKYNPWLARFLLVPAALTAPLLAAAASRRTVVTAVVGVVVLQLALVQIRNEQKPLNSGTRPWALTQAEALRLTFRPGFAGVSLALDRLVAPGTCIGAVVGPDDPSFVLFGDRLQRRVRFLPHAGATTAARASRLAVVVVRRASGLPARFARAGWRLRALGAPGTTPWLLATRQPAKEDRMAQSGGCGV